MKLHNTLKDVRIVNIVYCLHYFVSIHIHTHVGATTVEAYFPKGSRWYDVYTNKIVAAAGGATMTLDSPMDHIPVS